MSDYVHDQERYQKHIIADLILILDMVPVQVLISGHAHANVSRRRSSPPSVRRRRGRLRPGVRTGS
ncbi:hypothetical protein OHS33_00260 [Streptomyces sp. NBC_00536]|nr:hypothetical protein OHS33_00260 [Streptomyces sp. NBC_00536]